MKGRLIAGCPTTVGVIATMAWAPMFAGCAPSTTSSSQMAPGVAAAAPIDHGFVAGDARIPPQHDDVGPGDNVHHEPAPPSPAFVTVHDTNDTTSSITQLEEKPTMTAQTTPASHGKVEHADTNSFPQRVLHAGVPVLVDFYADWCGPCRMLAPVLDQVARETPDAKVVKVNIDDSPQLAKQYGVSSIPTVMVFKEGAVVAQHTGLADRGTLQRLIAR